MMIMIIVMIIYSDPCPLQFHCHPVRPIWRQCWSHHLPAHTVWMEGESSSASKEPLGSPLHYVAGGGGCAGPGAAPQPAQLQPGQSADPLVLGLGPAHLPVLRGRGGAHDDSDDDSDDDDDDDDARCTPTGRGLQASPVDGVCPSPAALR